MQQDMTANTSLLFGAALMQLAAASSSILTSGGTFDVTAENRLLGLCIVGSILGAFLAVAVLPPEKEPLTTRLLATHFAASCFAGLAFSPMLIEFLGWARTGSSVLGVSAAIALFSVVIIGTLSPRVRKWIATRKLP